MIRLLPLASADGPTNMALDEAMLDSAATRGLASIRWYTWDQPTVTLGYFQPASDPRPALPWVRRATGGHAIVHDPGVEITYSFAVPAGADWQPRGESWICRMHYLVRDLLAEWGVVSKAVVCGEEKTLGPGLCFWHQTPGDLAINGAKVMGSAQRKSRGALLQHGSLLVARSQHAPGLPGILEQTGTVVNPARVAAVVCQRWASALGHSLTAGDWTEAEMPVIQESVEKYRSKEWNEKR